MGNKLWGGGWCPGGLGFLGFSGPVDGKGLCVIIKSSHSDFLPILFPLGPQYWFTAYKPGITNHWSMENGCFEWEKYMQTYFTSNITAT